MEIEEPFVDKGRRSIDNFLRRFGGTPISALNNISHENYPELPDELFKILDYLPTEFADETEEKYIDALMLAAQTS